MVAFVLPDAVYGRPLAIRSLLLCTRMAQCSAFVTGVTVPIDGGAPLGSALFPVGKGRGTAPFDGFHRAVVPAVLDEGQG